LVIVRGSNKKRRNTSVGYWSSGSANTSNGFASTASARTITGSGSGRLIQE